MTAPLTIPVLITPPAKREYKSSIHPRLVAAIRWDYEYGLLSCVQLVEKYRLVVGQTTVRGIAACTLYPEVKAQRHALAWCKLKWRLT